MLSKRILSGVLSFVIFFCSIIPACHSLMNSLRSFCICWLVCGDVHFSTIGHMHWATDLTTKPFDKHFHCLKIYCLKLCVWFQSGNFRSLASGKQLLRFLRRAKQRLWLLSRCRKIDALSWWSLYALCMVLQTRNSNIPIMGKLCENKKSELPHSSKQAPLSWMLMINQSGLGSM